MIGDEIYALASKLWPINRSITGNGVRETLGVLKDSCVKEMELFEVPSGTKAFDWDVPKEWDVKDAYIIDPDGNKICDFSKNNLHLVGYSTPVDTQISLDELQKHLYSLPDQPNAIPYITSYYKERWGFCLSQEQRNALKDGTYKVFIDSKLFDGSLTYGQAILPGNSNKEVFISTYVCHPSMANNELSGPCVTAFLYKCLSELKDRKYTYRFVFIPETIGSIVYLSKNLDSLKKNVIAGFNVTCIGDDRAYSHLPSRNGETISDKTARHVLGHIDCNYKSYNWEERGSDERQYCAPNVDLPMTSIMRTKYAKYPEYHTSLDTLGGVVTAAGLDGGYNALKLSIEAVERNVKPKIKVFCEPQLGKRGLYPTISQKGSGDEVRTMMNLITWSDGNHTLLEIAEKCAVPVWELYPILDKLVANDLIELL